MKQPRQAGFEIIVAVLHAPLEAQGRVSHAAGQRERVAVDAQTGVAVAIDPQPEMLGDADARLGPVLEAFVAGQYYWVPLQRVSRLSLQPPGDALDLALADPNEDCNAAASI